MLVIYRQTTITFSLEGMKMKDFFYVYVLLSKKDGNFYTGFTNNLKRRIQEHQQGKNISTSRRLPVELVYFEGHKSKEDALRRESYFKTTKGKITIKQVIRTRLETSMLHYQITTS
jgi:putative endonuclease